MPSVRGINCGESSIILFKYLAHSPSHHLSCFLLKAEEMLSGNGPDKEDSLMKLRRDQKTTINLTFESIDFKLFKIE
jgi:hypothetical protein